MSYDETNTNLIAVADALERRYPMIYGAIRDACQQSMIHGMAFRKIEGCRNIWVRDFLPLQVGRRFIKFTYGYAADNPQFPTLRPRTDNWSWLQPLQKSRIRLDGGNVVRHKDQVIMTEIVFRHNAWASRSRLTDWLEKLFEARITVVPVEPGDDIGHTDGILHFIPATGALLVNDFQRVKSKSVTRYFDRLLAALAGFSEINLMPYAYHKTPWMSEKSFRRSFGNADTYNPGFGYYINFLLAGRLLFLPQFGIEEDAEAMAVAAGHFPLHRIVPVDCSRLSMEGGLVNCVAMNYTF